MAKSRKRQEGDSTAFASSAASGGNGNDSQPDPERISARAYELYLQRGGSDGQAWDDWLAAERELTQGSTTSRDAGGE